MSSFCNYFDQGQCRSCSWMEREYPDQLALKEAKLKAALDFSPAIFFEKSQASAQQGFRNRAKMSVTGSADAPVIGLVGEGSLDQGRELLHCPIHDPVLNELIAALPEFIRLGALHPYQIESRQGELKGLIAFRSPGSGEMYLRFVLRSRECVSRIRKILPALQARFPLLVAVSANIQPVPHAILEGPEEVFVTERTTIRHRLGPHAFQLSPRAFVQTNAEIAASLYECAAGWIAQLRPERLLELYSGQGAFSFFAAVSAGHCLGIELNQDAVKTAGETVLALGLRNVEFRCMDATRIESEALAFAPDLILVNPPRRGLGEGVELILRSAPRSLVYSSCSVETLARDLKKLAPVYRVTRARLFDMFPHTEHFETLVWCERA